MYEAFYGFRDLPFRLTPDPDYLFLSANHQEALGHLLFGISEGSGVVVITGEIGAGKTTLIRTLVRNLDARTTVAYIFNPVLSALELLQTINAELGLPATSASKKELTDDLNRFLLAQQAAGRRTVVLIDEAQNLEPAVLEQLRLLSNLETERAKLLQIILVGQPELAETLARADLTQLDQRVTLRWHLHPLPAEDTGAYIRHRLQVAAGGRTPVVFTPGGLRLVHAYSSGVPRLINVLCHRALLVAYTREERQISVAVVRQAIDELRRHGQETRSLLRGRSLAFNVALIVALLLGVGALSVLAASRGWLPHPWGAAIVPQTEPERGSETGAVIEKSETVKSESVSASTSSETPLPLGTPPVSQAVPVPIADSEITDVTSEAKAPTITGEAPVTPSLTPSQEAKDLAATEAFLRDLRAVSMNDSALQASDALLRTWGVEGLRANEMRRGSLDLSALARARRLAYLPFNGSLNLVALLDLPIILEIMLPEVQEARFVLLLGLSRDRCRILLESERELPLQVLTENWFGKGYILWKDFEELGMQLTVGSVGLNVQRLHRLLAKTQDVNGSTLPASGWETVFNRQTEASVARFQRTKRLTPDGVVGPLTMILLYNAVPTYTHPRLG
jgi:general secretion pathway protein A